MFSGGTTPHQHHAADLGKILLQAQADLRQIRESIADSKGGGGGAGSSSGVDAGLQRVVEKVETELRLKAEAVLNTVVHGSASTLPMLGAHNFSTSQPLETTEPAPTHAALLQRKKPPPPALRHTRSAGDSRADAIARPAAAAVAASRHRAALRNPNAALSRQHIADRYGVTAPTKHEASRPAGKAATGKLRTERVSGSLGVPPAAVRADPQAVAPIGPKDVAAGLYSLVTRGLIPPNVDLTPAMARKPAPLAQAPARVHDYKSQFASHHSSAYSARARTGGLERRPATRASPLTRAQELKRTAGRARAPRLPTRASAPGAPTKLHRSRPRPRLVSLAIRLQRRQHEARSDLRCRDDSRREATAVAAAPARRRSAAYCPRHRAGRRAAARVAAAGAACRWWLP